MNEDPQGDEDFAKNVINSIFDIFVTPELGRRNMSLARDEISKVVVEIDPDRKYPRVWINDQAQITAQVTATRAIEAGEQVTEADFDEVVAIMPNDIGPNSGYVCFATLAGSDYVRFDYRYNKERVHGLLARAREFLSAARTLAAQPAVACDLAFSAAELSVQAQMLLHQQKTKDHWVRQGWLDQWVEHGNAPDDHAAILRELHEHRGAGRYADGTFDVSEDKMHQLLESVDEMITVAEGRAS